MPNNRVLVVGTTPDYISYIDVQAPHRALFLSDSSNRESSSQLKLKNSTEIICNLQDIKKVLIVLKDYLSKQDHKLSGITCYDCEWLILAAKLALHFNLPFPSLESVKLARNKFLTKKRWKEFGVRSPKMELVHTGWQALRLIEQFGCPIVLKPTTGTGSELVFLCRDNADLSFAFHEIEIGLTQRSQMPLYNVDSSIEKPQVTEHPILAEEYIEGSEYSADFIIENDELKIIRLAKKIGNDALPFGTTTAYIVPAKLPDWLNYDILKEKLHQSAKALGFSDAICMIDFIITKNEIVFLELTPRIGGDCLPTLIKHCSGIDTIKIALDFAEKRKIEIPSFELWKEHIGLRLFAHQNGILIDVNHGTLIDNRLIKNIFIKYSSGHKITLPPKDYDSWILGHVIFESESDIPILEQCNKVKSNFRITMEQNHVQNIC